MSYDQKTGNVTIVDPVEERMKKKKRIITTTDDMENQEQRKKLYAELGLDEKGYPLDGSDPADMDQPEYVKKLEEAR